MVAPTRWTQLAAPSRWPSGGQASIPGRSNRNVAKHYGSAVTQPGKSPERAGRLEPSSHRARPLTAHLAQLASFIRLIW